MKRSELARMIDHTLLKSTATEAQIEVLCDEAKEHGFYSVCVNPSWVQKCLAVLSSPNVEVCTVIGFPLGSSDTLSKATEARIAVEKGADELDMVINVGQLLDGNHDYVEKDILAVIEAAHGLPVKVIIEICYLSEAQIVKACEIAKSASASFVKTSTGFGTSGATVEAIRLMRRTVGPEMGVKASGGIRDYKTAVKMIEAGASRIGASASVEIVMGAPE